MNSKTLTATFLFTDLENSTPLWDDHPDVMQELIARHDVLIREVIESNQGQVVKTTGDGFHAVFEAATDGVSAAIAAQEAIMEEPWPAETGPLKVRMGLHTGESRFRDGDYYGGEVNRAARVMGIAHGGQILVSEATAALIRHSLPANTSLTDLGRHRLRGLAGDERIYQLVYPLLPSEFPPLKSLSAYRHNLPVQLTSFIGRKKELANVSRLLEENRLLTLLGPGGSGKTRLMLEVAEEVIGKFAHGVWLVELAPLADPDLMAERVAAVLNIPEQPGRELKELLVAYLRNKELLLLLDNVEHLVREAAELAEHLLRHCPPLKILVTGREALFIDGEITLQIPSLSLPESNRPGTNGEVSWEATRASEGVQLFIARAQNVNPNFDLSPANAASIAEIVRRLDGIPFALELAAARLRMLSVEQIAERLSDRFRLLTGGRRTAMPRQQTLQAMIDWSWNLLDETERLLLQRLSVFSGGWSLEAAQAVATDGLLNEYDVFDAMEQLVNKSLVTVEYPEKGEARFGMLESIRQYGRDRLFDSGQGEAMRDRHAEYYAAFAEEAGSHLIRSTMLLWVKRIRLELDNLRAAMAWTLEERLDLALQISGNLLYQEANWIHPAEALSWLEPAVERARTLVDTEDNSIRPGDYIRAMISLAVTYAWQGRPSIAFGIIEEVIDLARKHGEDRLLLSAVAMKYFTNPFDPISDWETEINKAIAIARSHRYEFEIFFLAGVCGAIYQAQGKPGLAAPYFREMLDANSRINNPRLNASAHRAQAFLAKEQGDFEAAKKHMRIAIESYKALNERIRLIGTRSDLAHMYRQTGYIKEAEDLYRRTIVGWLEFAHFTAVAHQLECFAFISISRGQYRQAAILLGAAGKIRKDLEEPSTNPQEIEELAAAMDALATVMGEAERDEAMAEGTLIDLDDAVQIAIDGNA